MAFERHLYGNPEQIAMNKQERSCHGCKHESVIKICFDKISICDKGKKYGSKCKLFIEKGPHET